MPDPQLGTPATPLSPSGHMKLSALKIKVLTAATGAALETNVHAFTAVLGEERFLSVTFGKPDGGDFWAIIAYVE